MPPHNLTLTLQRLTALWRRLNAIPPDLPANYARADYAQFMRAETYSYSQRYACQRVVIHGEDHLLRIAQQGGGMLACLHYGSFFLSGGAIVRQLGLPYTAVVTSRNLLVLPEAEAAFWKAVHRRAEMLYDQALFSTGAPPRILLNWLKTKGNMLGVVLDVREYGHKIKEHSFNFMGQPIFMQTGPAKLACLARVPLVPMTIRYDLTEKRHHLYFDAPIMPTDPVGMTQEALTILGRYVAKAPNQLYQDIVRDFAIPHVA